MDCIEKVYWLREEILQAPLDVIFFVCPRRSQEFQVNDLETGFTTEYTKGISESSEHHLQKLPEMVGRLKGRVAIRSLTGIFSGADALILPPVALPPPQPPVEIAGIKELRKEIAIKIVSNYEAVWFYFPRWAHLYYTRPWEQAPEWAREMEEKRLRRLLVEVPERLANDFVWRVFAGFSLDGVLIREGEFGTPNPVLLGIESPGVALLQNAAVGKNEKVPIIQVSQKFR